MIMVLAWSKFIAWFRKLMVQGKLTLILPLLLTPKEKNMFVAQRKIWNQKSRKDCALTPGKYCMYVSDRLSSINTSCSFSLDTFLTLSRRKVTYLEPCQKFLIFRYLLLYIHCSENSTSWPCLAGCFYSNKAAFKQRL